MSTHGKPVSPFKQPKAVWAVAFACVISFMGIGLVDPILPALATGLHASPSDVSLLFTSYLVVTAVAMLGVGWVSSRIGSKWTLILGLVLIVVFSALAGASDTIGGIIGFRAGWGLGNALFIATSLAVIVASAKGGFGGAIILYETALGIGIAVGPLLGGELGSISWRGPFYGVAALMAIALIATLLFVPQQPKPAVRTKLSAPLTALKHRGLLIMGLVALLYNWGFFTMLGYAPYPMELGPHELGLVFFGWGVLVALFAVFFAPRLQRRFGTVAVLYANMVGLAVVMAVIAVGVHEPAVVITAVIVSGAFIGINNTLTTQAVMLVAPVERPVASSAYGFVRFIGGGLAPFVAGKIAEATNQSVAFWVGAAAFLLAVPVLASGAKLVTRAERTEEADVVLPTLEPLGRAAAGRPVVVAVRPNPEAASMVDRAAELAAREGAPLEIVHVRETDIVEELAISPETEEEARAAVSGHVDRLAAHGTDVRGLVLHSVGDHAATASALARHAAEAGALALVVRKTPHGPVGRHLAASLEAAADSAHDGARPELVVVDLEAEASEA
ncbi:MFS transporter [Sinomonas cellulolyticus]|uniref:MFS transporter n=1 Tax=Sinomonas cellulolyticus TaxID=2801916 RepID=A0ABS1K355_9MICC|nr:MULTISPECIES: MFS transporter [Sinomonas]MBL0706099.1 MFS transporter [Sinomonas cellulolyticus]GHG43468.1 MFS transporter [Sinomonas sp. KCTC 49339]